MPSKVGWQKPAGYTLIRIKEEQLLQEYDGVKEKISLLVGKENL